MTLLLATALAAPATDLSAMLVSTDGLPVGTSGNVGVASLQAWPWRGRLELGVRESVRLVSGPFVSTQVQGALGVRLGPEHGRFEAGYHLLAGGWMGGTWGRAHYPDLDVDQSYSALNVRPAVGASATTRVWLGERAGICLDVYVPAWPFEAPVRDGHAPLVGFGLSLR